MPQATVSQEVHHHDLRNCPGGYVELKALPYGMLLERRERAMEYSMLQDTKARKTPDSQKLDVRMMQRYSTQFEFENCIVDHNLEDENGRKLNFSNPKTLDQLNPKIGQEIEELIGALNKEEDDEDLEDFPKPVSTFSEAETDKGSLAAV